MCLFRNFDQYCKSHKSGQIQITKKLSIDHGECQDTFHEIRNPQSDDRRTL